MATVFFCSLPHRHAPEVARKVTVPGKNQGRTNFFSEGVSLPHRGRQAKVRQVGCWSEADAALAELGQVEQRLEAVENERRAAVAAAESGALVAGRRPSQERARLLRLLEKFCCRHQSELARRNGHSRRSRRLLFGRMGWRGSLAVVVEKEAKALRLLAHWRTGQRFLRVRTELDREGLRDFLLSAAKRTEPTRRRLRRAGIRLEQRQNWFYETDREALRRWGQRW